LPPVNLWFLNAGYCTHPEFVSIRGGSRKPVRFNSSVAVIEHPQHGVILFDAGYSTRFHDVTRKFPDRLYALVTPVTISPEDVAVHQLKQKGVAASDVRMIVVSHFHADHIGGVGDFPQAQYVYQKAGYDFVRGLQGFARVCKGGFLPGLLPSDFEARSRPVLAGDANALCPAPFKSGWDLLGDGSIVLVDLPGHARGHSGLLVSASDGHRYFLVGDACWSARAYREKRLPFPITRLIFDDWTAYRETLHGLHDLNRRDPDLRIVPCHCSETVDAHREHFAKDVK
jgi:glyoxylase-like metal-dependent hydrolase (beta-lactamase superfamily II)